MVSKVIQSSRALTRDPRIKRQNEIPAQSLPLPNPPHGGAVRAGMTFSFKLTFDTASSHLYDVNLYK
jgi:hypothetical protein